MKSALRLLIALVLTLLGTTTSAAHEVRPVFLEGVEVRPGHFDLTWKRPDRNGAALRVQPRFDAGCTLGDEAPRRSDGVFTLNRLRLHCPKGLAGTDIHFDGLSATMVDGLVRLEFASGEIVTGIVRPHAPSFHVPSRGSAVDVLRTYSRLGVEHILLGFDHLLFVLALALFVQGWRRLLVAATAFTVAHSVTLSMTTLGLLTLPVPFVEAMIALSIVLLAVELLSRAEDPKRGTGLRPAGLAFGFGLLHGLGFASALAEIGLPRHDVPLALFAFNVGVELGQLAFMLVLLALAWLCRSLSLPTRRWAYLGSAYGIGGLAAFWTLQRIADF